MWARCIAHLLTVWVSQHLVGGRGSGSEKFTPYAAHVVGSVRYHTTISCGFARGGGFACAIFSIGMNVNSVLGSGAKQDGSARKFSIDYDCTRHWRNVPNVGAHRSREFQVAQLHVPTSSHRGSNPVSPSEFAGLGDIRCEWHRARPAYMLEVEDVPELKCKPPPAGTDDFAYFHVDVLKRGARTFGMNVKVCDGYHEVEYVHDNSPISDWNARTAKVFPSDQVRKGDQIVYVNHVKEVAGFAKAFEEDRLFMIVRRPWWAHASGRAKRGMHRSAYGAEDEGNGSSPVSETLA